MLCDLPSEIIIQILAELSPNDLSSCKLINNYLNNIVEDSVVLQFGAALVAARAEDNPCSNLPVAEKIKALKSAEHAWSFVKPRFLTSVPVTHNQSGVYDLTGGVYLLSNSARTSLHYLKLPSKEGEAVQWKRVDFKKTIIDIGLCLFEHDLIAIVTTTRHASNTNMPASFDIELHFLEFSTGKPYPKARESSILVMNSQWEKPAVGIEIVGDNLVLILSYNSPHRPDDRVFIYDWQKNILKMSFLAPYRTYSGLIFLTEHLILVPNVRTNALDIYRIPTKPTLVSPTPILILRLPALADERIMGGISCRAEPNPIGAASALSKRREAETTADDGGNVTETIPERGFLARAEEAICIFEMRILALRLNLLQGGWNMDFQFRDRFSFIVHRSAFVKLVEKYGRKDDEGVTESDPMNAHLSSTSPQLQTPPSSIRIETDAAADAEGVASTTQNPTPDPAVGSPSAEWAAWGPPVTRWFNSDNVLTRWITISAGQRCVRMEDNPPATGLPFTILDFNPNNIHKMEKHVSKMKEYRMSEFERDFGAWFAGQDDSQSQQVSSGNHTFSVNDDGVSDSATTGSSAPTIDEEFRQEDFEWFEDGTPTDLNIANNINNWFAGHGQDDSQFQQGSSANQPSFVDDDAVSDSATIGSSAPMLEDDEETRRADEEHAAANPDPSPQVPMLTKIVPDVIAQAGPVQLGSTAHRMDLRDFENDDGDPGFQQGSSGHRNPGDNVVSTSVTIRPLSMSRIEDEEDQSRDNNEQDSANSTPISSPSYVGDSDINDYIIPDDDGEGEHEDGDDDADDEYEDAEMHLDGDGSDGSTEDGMMDVGDLVDDAENDNDVHMHNLDRNRLYERIRIITSVDQVEPVDAFAEPVLGGLSYIACDSEELYTFDGVLLDEERVLGIRTDENDRIERVEILYFG